MIEGGGQMDNQTLLNIVLGIITAYLAIKNFINNNRKEVMRESEEMTEIKVQLSQVMSMLRDVQKDLRTSTAEFRTLSERVAIMETKLNDAFERINELKKVKGDSDGKQRELENQKEHVEQNRFRSWALWLSVIGAIWTILNAFGLPEKWGIPETTFKTVVDAIGVILIGFGICNNPTDKANF